MTLRRAFREAAEHHARARARRGGQFRRDSADRDARGAIGWKAIDAGGDRRERNRCETVRRGQIERGGVAGREQRILVRVAAVPHRTDRVDDVTRRQPVAARDFRRPGLAAAKRAAFGQQLRPCGTMDRAVDAAAAEQRRVRGVDDRVDDEGGDVGDEDVAGRGTDGEGEEGLRHALILSLPREAGEGGRALRGRVGCCSVRARAPPDCSLSLAATLPALRGGISKRHAHSALASSRKSTVLRTPISSKCRSRNFFAACAPPFFNISKKSKSESSFELAVNFPNVSSSEMRWTLMRRYSPLPMPRGSFP